MSVSEEKLRSLVESYGDAWNTQDLDAIVGHYTADSRFQLHVGGEPAEGRSAVREAFAAVAIVLADGQPHHGVPRPHHDRIPRPRTGRATQ